MVNEKTNETHNDPPPRPVNGAWVMQYRDNEPRWRITSAKTRRIVEGIIDVRNSAGQTTSGRRFIDGFVAPLIQRVSLAERVAVEAASTNGVKMFLAWGFIVGAIAGNVVACIAVAVVALGG